jgi:hypothetical protein
MPDSIGGLAYSVELSVDREEKFTKYAINDFHSIKFGLFRSLCDNLRCSAVIVGDGNGCLRAKREAVELHIPISTIAAF